MDTFNFLPGHATTPAASNPVGDCSEGELTDLLRRMCLHGDAADAEIEDQIEALAPVVIELRDRSGVDLNMKMLSEYGTAFGFSVSSPRKRASLN
jgi:hypothetical protein